MKIHNISGGLWCAAIFGLLVGGAGTVLSLLIEYDLYTAESFTAILAIASMFLVMISVFVLYALAEEDTSDSG